VTSWNSRHPSNALMLSGYHPLRPSTMAVLSLTPLRGSPPTRARQDIPQLRAVTAQIRRAYTHVMPVTETIPRRILLPGAPPQHQAIAAQVCLARRTIFTLCLIHRAIVAPPDHLRVSVPVTRELTAPSPSRAEFDLPVGLDWSIRRTQILTHMGVSDETVELGYRYPTVDRASSPPHRLITPDEYDYAEQKGIGLTMRARRRPVVMEVCYLVGPCLSLLAYQTLNTSHRGSRCLEVVAGNAGPMLAIIRARDRSYLPLLVVRMIGDRSSPHDNANEQSNCISLVYLYLQTVFRNVLSTTNHEAEEPCLRKYCTDSRHHFIAS
jgi:hypothetical protein